MKPTPFVQPVRADLVFRERLPAKAEYVAVQRHMLEQVFRLFHHEARRQHPGRTTRTRDIICPTLTVGRGDPAPYCRTASVAEDLLAGWTNACWQVAPRGMCCGNRQGTSDGAEGSAAEGTVAQRATIRRRVFPPGVFEATHRGGTARWTDAVVSIATSPGSASWAGHTAPGQTVAGLMNRQRAWAAGDDRLIEERKPICCLPDDGSWRSDDQEVTAHDQAARSRPHWTGCGVTDAEAWLLQAGSEGDV